MKLRPLGNRIIVRPMGMVEESQLGELVIVSSTEDKPTNGEVIAVGNGASMAVQAGDRVLFGKYSGHSIKFGDYEVLVMREEDILGVVEA